MIVAGLYHYMVENSKDLNSPRRKDITFWYHLDFKRQECCSSRFVCSFSMSSAWWTSLCESQNHRVLIVMYPAFLKAIKPGYILKYSSWMETDLNNWKWIACYSLQTYSEHVVSWKVHWSRKDCLSNFKRC